MKEVTRILSGIEQGDPHASEELLTLVYEELRKLAAQKLAREKPGQTLQPTALVHEAYIRLVAPAKSFGTEERLLAKSRALLRRGGGSHAANPCGACSPARR
jgi:hypothetical protein